MSNVNIYKGNIIFTKVPEKFEIFENGYIIVENNKIVKVCSKLDEQYINFEVKDYGDKLIIPGFVDAHIHAPQYENIGLGYDKELLPWLETYTFPEESKYSDLEYVKKVYGRFVNDLVKCGTTRAVIFATIHKEATKLLFDLLAEKGIGAYVGKVNMDRNSAELLQESTEDSIRITEEIIKEYSDKYELIKPIITPRFVPTCTPELMNSLGEMAKKYNLPVQSHLSENKGEIEWVKALHPEFKNYGDVYDNFGLFGQSPTIMAHCVYCTDDEVSKMKNQGVYIAHCPDSNIDLSSGIAPIRRYMQNGLKVVLGSDVSGGHALFMTRAIVAAIQASKLYEIYVDNEARSLNTAEAFYLATKAGGEFFGKVGSFEEGYDFDALVIDDSDIIGFNKRSLEERVQRFIFVGKESNIVDKYVAGKNIC